MYRRQPLPRLWMMTDERMGDALLPAIERLPRGAGIVFRHYGLEPADRRKLFARIRKLARSRGLVLMLSGPPRTALAWGADGSHGWKGGKGRAGPLLRSASVHDLAELKAAERKGVDFVFVSPVFATRSHPGTAPLGSIRFGLLTRHSSLPVIALGGMNEPRARRLAGLGMHGWAAIDAWTHKSD